MKRIIKRCIMMVCAVILLFAVTACNIIDRVCTLAETEIAIGEATLDSLMFSLDGVIYTFPVHFSELEANGWSPYDPDVRFATETLEPRDYEMWELVCGNQNVLVFIINLSEEVLPVSESYITSVVVLVQESITLSYNAELIIPGNITIGSTLEDVFAAYGTTATWMNEFEETSALSITYSTDYYNLSITVDTKNNVVVYIDFCYWSYLWVQPDPEPTPLRK